jgi:hypothetical protein
MLVCHQGRAFVDVSRHACYLEWAETEILPNSLFDWGVSMSLFVVAWTTLGLIRRIIWQRLRRHE